MYKEYSICNEIKSVNTLALDWDETISDYPLAFRALAKPYDRVIIVTVNNELTIGEACHWFERSTEDLEIFCCPYENMGDIPGWKAEVCYVEKVALMFDDNPYVVRACHQKGVNAICVSERDWKFEE